MSASQVKSHSEGVEKAVPEREAAVVSRRRWWVLVVIGLAQLMVVLDTTVMNIALPSAQTSLAFSDTQRPWILTSYTLAFGSLLLLSGRLADRLGRRTLFTLGLAGFAIASAVGGAAVNFGMLVASRAVQGAFAALLAPAALALLTTTFPAGKERARAFGVFGAIGVAGSTIGLLVGGALTQYLSWRWTMYINIAFAVPAFLGALSLLPGGRQDRNASPLDLPGAITASGGLFALVFGFSRADTDGWGSATTIAFLAAGVLLLAAFVLLQSRASHPLLPLRVLADRNRAAGLLGMFVGIAALLAVVFFMAYYVQGVLGYSAVMTGVAFLPQPIALVLTAAVVGPRLNRRVSPKVTVPTGMVLGAVAVFLITRIGVEGNYVGDILPSLITLGIGLGLIFATSTSIATQGVQQQDTGVASALVSTSQQVGGSIGLAVLNTIATTAATRYVSSHRGGPATLLQATVHSYTVAFWWAGGLFLLGAVITAVLLRPGIPAHLAGREPQRHEEPIPVA